MLHRGLPDRQLATVSVYTIDHVQFKCFKCVRDTFSVPYYSLRSNNLCGILFLNHAVANLPKVGLARFNIDIVG
jgi:hypothetical protein